MKRLKEIVDEVLEAKFEFYVYILYKPDLTPFYVGKGKINPRDHKAQRLEWHEYEAGLKKPLKNNPYLNRLKVNTIRKIWKSNQEVLYTIDSWHQNEKDAYDREKELIASIGRKILGTGMLTNITEGGEREGITEETKQRISNSLKEYFKDPEARKRNSEGVKKYYEDPEARELARQNAIKTKAGDGLIQWMKDNPEGIKERSKKASKGQKAYYDTHPEEAKQLFERRNKVLRSEGHRKLMAEKTRLYILNNPEDNKKRREKAVDSLRKTFAEKMSVRQECMQIVYDRLLELKETNPVKSFNNKVIHRWNKRGLLKKHFPAMPRGNDPIEKWQEFKEQLNGCKRNTVVGT